MPRLRILAGLAGSGLQPGEVRDVPAEEAQRLLAQGWAELVRDEPVETPERESSVEATSARRTRTRKPRETRQREV